MVRLLLHRYSLGVVSSRKIERATHEFGVTRRFSGAANGRFTLVFVKRPKGWRILRDHTS